jgi:DNA-binding CsgD family transcriptional regulator/tetratricopeptide (TPR) repeat protein
MGEAMDDLLRGRDAYAQSRWRDAYAALAAADRQAPIPADDLVLQGMSALLTGKMPEALGAFERAHQAFLDAGAPLLAARVAVMLGVNLAVAGEIGSAGGWFGRAQRIVEREDEDCVERGYLLLPVVFRYESSGDYERCYEESMRAASIAERFHDHDLLATTLHVAGLARIKRGEIEDGLGLLDEAMVSVTGGEVGPFFTGVVYCGVIALCEEAFEPRRAQEWTAALSEWCDSQPQLVSFTGRCLAHRAAIKQLHGDWGSALVEARLARERCEQAMNRAAAGQAYYQQAEVLRLQGDLAQAEEAYRSATGYGREPQPGLALLRLAQGDVEAATGAIRRAVAVTVEPLLRAVLLPAYVEIMLASGELDDARSAADELEAIAGSSGRPMLAALASYATGAAELAGGDAAGAISTLRRSRALWQELDAPYEVARTQVLAALACRTLGDRDTAAVELEAARECFRTLGAVPDAEKVDGLLDEPGDETHGLTPRELEVLRLVAGGKTNREIASILVVSEHTVARHVQNILLKLRVSSRTAATAFAFEHELV